MAACAPNQPAERPSGEPINVARDSAGDSMTLGSLVMELDLSALHFAPGPPAEEAYSVWTFR